MCANGIVMDPGRGGGVRGDGAGLPRIFVRLAAYRDAECAPTRTRLTATSAAKA